jgi:hypothetical protein
MGRNLASTRYRDRCFAFAQPEVLVAQAAGHSMETSEELIRDVSLWVTDVGVQAAQLPTQPARACFLAAKFAELMAVAHQTGMNEHDAVILAQACIEGAERVTQELLARGTPMGGGRA